MLWGDEIPLTESVLEIYDVTNPAMPTKKSLGTLTVPISIYWDIDTARQVLFVTGFTDDMLYAYDVAGDDAVELLGDAIDVQALYPEDNNSSFQLRNLTVDPARNRLYMARQQGILSELVAFEYPSEVPQNGASYSDFASYDSLVKIEDGFDLSVDPGERPNLLGAHTPVVVPATGDVLLVANAWNGAAPSAVLVGMKAGDLSLASSCEAYEGFGCFYRGYASGSAVSYKQTEGAACYDQTRQIFVDMTLDPNNPDLPGTLVAFTIDEADLGMTPLLTDAGGNMPTGGTIIALACH